MPTNDRLDISLIKAGLKTRLIGSSIEYLDSVVSTNLYLKEKLYQNQVPVGHVVIAEHQSGGEGRHGRSWDSPSALGLWLSVLLGGDKQSGHVLTMAAGVAVIRAVRQTIGQRLSIRWPNDVYYEKSKVAGILCKGVKNQTRYILGIGLNVNQTQSDFADDVKSRAASLRQITGETVDRESLLVHLLCELEKQIFIIEKGDVDTLLMRYVAYSQLNDRSICLQMKNRQVSGKVLGYTREGAIILENNPGKREHFFEGEVKEVIHAAGD